MVDVSCARLSWLRNVWWRRRPIIRTPLERLDEAIDYVGFYIDYVEAELSPPRVKSYYLHDDEEEDDYDWPYLQISSLEIALEIILDVIAALRSNVGARLGP